MATTTKIGSSILAGGYVLPTTGITVGASGFNADDKVVIDKNLSTKEEVYIKNIFHDKILLKTALKYSHDYHADVENRFQGLNEVKDTEDLNAPTVSPIKINKVKLSETNQNSGSVLVAGTDISSRTLIHQTSSSDSIYEEVYLWGYNDSENDVDLTIEFGGLSENINGGNPSYQSDKAFKITIPSRQGLFSIASGFMLKNSSRITAFASSSNKIFLSGYVNKINQTEQGVPTANSSLLVNSSCLGWGENFFGQASVPAKISSTKRNTVKGLAAGYNNSFVILENDTIQGWGSNSHQQLSVPSEFNHSDLTTTLIKNVEKISIGSNHVIALYQDNNSNTYIKSWGSYSEDTVPMNLGVVKDISAGSLHNLALLNDGTVVGWGDNQHGQAKGVASSGLATGVFGGNVSGAAGELLDDVTAISAGGNHSLALRNDSGVVAWGSNYTNQCTIPSSATGVVQISAGLNHNLALREDGVVIAWGDNGLGQVDVPSGLSVPNAEISGVATAGNASLAWTVSGSIIQWGGPQNSKIKTAPSYDIKNIYCGLEHCISTNISGMRSEGVPVL